MNLTLDRKRQLALIVLLVGILFWLPTLLRIPSPLWLLSFPLGLMGAYFAYQAKAASLLVANVCLFFSYFLLLALFTMLYN